MVELADTRDLKSRELKSSCGCKSRSSHSNFLFFMERIFMSVTQTQSTKKVKKLSNALPLKAQQSCVYLEGIRTFKKNNNGETLETLKHYEENVLHFLHSKKIRRRFGLENIIKVLHDEEMLSYLIFRFIQADYLYDKNRQVRKANKQTLRYLFGSQTLIKYFQHQQKYKKRNFILSLDLSYDSYIQSLESLKNLIVTNTNNGHNPTVHCVLKQEKQQKVHELLELAPPKIKDMIEKHYIKQLSFAKIGEIYNISPEGVRQNIQRGIALIRDSIKINKNLNKYWHE